MAETPHHVCSAPAGMVSMRNSSFFRNAFAFFAVLYAPLPAIGADVPKFEDHPVSGIYQGKVHSPDLSDPDARTFRTRLREAARRRPDFAGRYVVATWGCGTSCVSGAILDASTGKVHFFPFSICCWGNVDDKFQPVEFRLTSRLIIFSGLRNEEGAVGSHFYLFEDGKFTHLRTVKTSDSFGNMK